MEAGANVNVDASAMPDAGEGSSGNAGQDTGAPIDSGGAGADADAGSDGGLVQVSLQFKAMVGAQTFACGTTYTGQGVTSVSVTPQDFRFYVQDVKLVDAAGNEVPVTLDTRTPWKTPDVALLDFENGTGACAAEGNSDMNTVVTGSVPQGMYVGIVFSNGVPDSLDHADPLNVPAPLQPAPMSWGWLYGYKFIKAELAATATPAGDAEPGLGLFHLGSTDCTNATDGGTDDFTSGPLAACGQPNRNVVHLTGYALGSSVIVADIGAIFQGEDLSVNNQCHSNGDPSCAITFASAGVDETTGAPLLAQSIYRLSSNRSCRGPSPRVSSWVVSRSPRVRARRPTAPPKTCRHPTPTPSPSPHGLRWTPARWQSVRSQTLSRRTRRLPTPLTTAGTRAATPGTYRRGSRRPLSPRRTR
jgi:uncharacterized repeat protein (TIGR04052 family)